MAVNVKGNFVHAENHEDIKPALGLINNSILSRTEADVYYIAGEFNKFFGDDYIIATPKAATHELPECTVIETWGMRSFRRPNSKRWIWLVDKHEIPELDSKFRGIVRNLVSHVCDHNSELSEDKYQAFKTHMGW